MSDEDDPAGPRIKPLNQTVIDNFLVQDHQFSVNGGKTGGEFSPLTLIQSRNLESYYRSLPDVNDADVMLL